MQTIRGILALYTVFLLVFSGSHVLADTPLKDYVYVTASKANLRESPNPSATVVKKIGIATQLEILRPYFPWLEVLDLQTGYSGYIHESLVSTERPTVEQALQQMQRSEPRERLQWAERAAALAPENIEVLALLGEELDRRGEFARANTVRTEILRITKQFNEPEDWKAVFAYHGYGVETLAFYKRGAFVDPDSSEENYRKNLKFFHRRGNKYHLFTNVGMSAELEVRNDAPRSRFEEYGNCLLDTSAETSEKSTFNGKVTAYRIATNFIPTPPYPVYQVEKDKALIQEVSELTKAGFKDNLWKSDLERLTLQELEALKSSQTILSIGHADLDADNSQDYIVVANYQLRDSEREIAYSALYLLKKSKGNWEMEFTDFAGSSGDAISESAAYIGHIDIDGDGIQEFFLSRDHYEGSSITLIKKINGSWQSTGIGSYKGC